MHRCDLRATADICKGETSVLIMAAKMESSAVEDCGIEEHDDFV
jgi:hypothetical protein